MTAALSRFINAAQFAVGLAGFCAFINLYAPQAILPLLSREFGATAAEVSSLITVSTLAVAVTAPFTGAVADVLGRKRVIVTAMFVIIIPTVMIALSQSLSAMIFWRAVQGLVLPPIFTVVVAYIGDEWNAAEATKTAGIYSSASSIGGFAGRLCTGILADLVSWRAGFMTLAAMALVCAIGVMWLLPKERGFVRSEGLGHAMRQMLTHFHNGQLLATFAVGFGVLFNFISTFTYVSFHLALPPYGLTATALGALFVVYLAGSALAPWVGWAVARFGRRRFMIRVIAIWMVGIALTLLSPLPVIVLGLTISAACGLMCQAVSTGYVAITAKVGRSSAVGLYVTSFYIGGSCGSALGGLAWTYGKWPLCVALIIAMLIIMMGVVTFLWTKRVPPSPEMLPIEPP
ncbi:MAG: putative MFS-type transporter [Pseudolabrys sp.]|jgi:predicted MFS family arabinose efflux permease|nr:putative MFS-type transporter [Pseudolabrys sp.]